MSLADMLDMDFIYSVDLITIPEGCAVLFLVEYQQKCIDFIAGGKCPNWKRTPKANLVCNARGKREKGREKNEDLKK